MLVLHGAAAEEGVVFVHRKASQGHAAGQGHAGAQHRVVADVHLGHDEAILADAGELAFAVGALHGDVGEEDRPVAHRHAAVPGSLAAHHGGVAQHHPGMDVAGAAQAGAPVNDHVGVQPGPLADFHRVFEYAVRPHQDIRGQARARMHYGCRVDGGLGLYSLERILFRHESENLHYTHRKSKHPAGRSPDAGQPQGGHAQMLRKERSHADDCR